MNTLTNDIAVLRADLDDGADRDIMMILADALEDNFDCRAPGLRALAQRQARPKRVNDPARWTTEVLATQRRVARVTWDSSVLDDSVYREQVKIIVDLAASENLSEYVATAGRWCWVSDDGSTQERMVTEFACLRALLSSADFNWLSWNKADGSDVYTVGRAGNSAIQVRHYPNRSSAILAYARALAIMQ